MDLWEYNRNKRLKTDAPLAARMRPASLDEFVGQEHIVGKNKLLYRAIIADKIGSVIFYGPAGTGKTTLAKIIANTTKSYYVQINATTAGIKDIKETVEIAKDKLGLNGMRTILFIDEIHRFNKAQQDALLPSVEEGLIILIGATTENPYFEVNKALVSRSAIFQLKLLSADDILSILKRAVADYERGLGKHNVTYDEEALLFLSEYANGDARAALNAIELAVLSTEPINGGIHITIKIAEDCIQKRAIGYDKKDDYHYDTISAFIKSMRGSNPDAAVYYLARMLYAGEDPMFIARRIVICASEDVGNADPHALMLASAAASAVHMIGMPEARIILSQACIYVACAPKSNASYVAVNSAYDDVEKVKISAIPPHLKNAPIEGMKNFGNSIGYKYAHDYDGNYVKQQFLPDELVGKQYYNPTQNGVEKKIKELLERLRK